MKMHETDYAFWVALIISSIFGANDKLWQAALWVAVAVTILIGDMAFGK